MLFCLIGSYFGSPGISLSPVQWWPSSRYLPVLLYIADYQEVTQDNTVVPVTLLEGKVLFIEHVFKDYFYSIRISVQDIKLTSAVGLLMHKSNMSTLA